MNINNITEFLPFLIPILLVEFGLLAYTLHHIFTHKTYKMFNRVTWVIITIVFCNIIGPVLYLVLGKDD